MPHATGSRGLQAPAPAGLLRVRRPSGVPPAGTARGLVRYLWASPNTLLGLGFAALAVAGGELRVVGGVLEAHGPLLRWILTRLVPLRGGALAVTLGHVVVARDARALDETRDHERAHMVQCERWGPWFIPAYLSASLWALARGRDPYLDNAFEREAFAVERRGRGLKAEALALSLGSTGPTCLPDLQALGFGAPGSGGISLEPQPLHPKPASAPRLPPAASSSRPVSP